MSAFRTMRNVSVGTIFIVLVATLLAVAPAAAAVCGNGTVETGEDCDDGSSQNGGTNSCCTSTCTFAPKAPNVIVGDLVGVSTYLPSVGGIHAYSVGTTSCNLGSCWLNWFSSIPEHPVIGQNMYRLKNGRFEQVGQSWLKHGFTALTGSVCASCVPPPSGSHLGVNCSDPYSSSLNGSQSNLGPKQDVNPNTGVYPYPDSRINTTGNNIFKRLQVHDTDLDPAQNAGALYFVEGQYVTHDDASAKRQDDNASYRPLTVADAAHNFDITLTGSTQRQKWGIQAWKATDPTVTETMIGASEGLFMIAAKATSLGGGIYHYEYAVANLTNNRAAQTFSVPLPPGTVVTNVGFHDVDYHSGEPFDGTDWTSTIASDSVTWSTVGYGVNPNANALRWGTLYNFRFDANQAPGSSSVTIGLFKPSTPPGGPMSASGTTVTPGICGGAPGGSPCSDGNACTVNDTCQSGVCTPGTPVTCTASDACHLAGTCSPATGACSNPAKPDGSGCSDGNLCTTSDSCQSGVCTGANPVVCTASDACHLAGTCVPATGACSSQANAPDGTTCSDGSACTQTDGCQAGACIGGNPVVCTASDVCHVAGTCAPATGACTNPAAPDGTACSDGDACTQADGCQGGACVAGNPVVCTASDACHVAGTCAPATGDCSNPAAPDGTECSDGDGCTAPDTCASGACVAGSPVVCAPIDGCHDAGTCDSATGCSNPIRVDGSACDDLNSCTIDDACSGGVCVGSGIQVPAEVDGIQVVAGEGGDTTISWNLAAGSNWSAVIRGLVSKLPVGPGGDDEVCLANGIPETLTSDAAIPPDDDAYWYLVQGGNNCGRGSFGFQSQSGVATIPRVSSTCP